MLRLSDNDDHAFCAGRRLPVLWQHCSVAHGDEQKKTERGRPRSGTTQRPDLSAAAQILDAAAHLFVERGFSATSTRAIADEVGIRQASLYYHFASKERILHDLLMRTVEPSTRAATDIAAAPETSEARLYALIDFDTRQLFLAGHNIGSLYLLPEIRNELFASFRQERQSLRAIYAALIAESIAPATRVELGPARDFAGKSPIDYLGDVVFGMVESVIAIRADNPHDDASVLVPTIARSCLRVLGHSGVEIDQISERAAAIGRRLSADAGLGATTA